MAPRTGGLVAYGLQREAEADDCTAGEITALYHARMTTIYPPVAALNVYPNGLHQIPGVPFAALHDYVAAIVGPLRKAGPSGGSSWRQVGVPLVSQTRPHPAGNRCSMWAVDSLSAPCSGSSSSCPHLGHGDGMADNLKIFSPSSCHCGRACASMVQTHDATSARLQRP